MAEMLRRPTLPGEILREDFMPDYQLDAEELAAALGVSRAELDGLLEEREPLGVEMALRLNAYFGNSPQFWLNVQREVDIWDTRQGMREELTRIEPIDPDRSIYADEQPMTPEEVAELKEALADSRDPMRHVIAASLFDDEHTVYYDVSTDCWATDLAGGTFFKRVWAAEKIAAGLESPDARIVAVSPQQRTRTSPWNPSSLLTTEPEGGRPHDELDCEAAAARQCGTTSDPARATSTFSSTSGTRTLVPRRRSTSNSSMSCALCSAPRSIS